MKILYKQENGRLAIIQPTSEALEIMTIDEIALKDVPMGLHFAIVEDSEIPTDRAYREAWVIDDNLLTNSNVDSAVITLNQTTVEEIKLKRTPTLTRRQFKLVLSENELLTVVETAISSIADIKLRERIQIEYSESTEFVRTSDSVKYMLSVLNLTEEQVDTIWEQALTL